ncbi:MAG: type II toxin-antitoxin system VapC family toxin [Chloroflexota bacterium]|nr:type II toxin-antitoxin system VapC family toxin [Chloroflexota bacterium]
MATYYLDTSALVKRYAREQGTRWITALTDPILGHNLYTVQLTGPEMIAALFRKVRTGAITLADATRAGTDFRQDWQTQYLVLNVTETLIEHAMSLAQAHGLRGFDAVHLATALAVHDLHRSLQLPAITFVSADIDQHQAAATEGLLVEDPNAYP